MDFRILIAVLDVFWDSYFYEIYNSKRDKDDLIFRLKSISPIRNAIAHNRYISNIDLNDLRSLLKLLSYSINKSYLKDFDKLTTNSYEIVAEKILNMCNVILWKISEKLVISKGNINSLKSTYSVFNNLMDNGIDIQKLVEIVELLNRYNNLPRRPGSGEMIKKFLNSSLLVSKISNLISIIEEKV